jgi:uncharacterized protein involved in type VI secretion and phage assembly
MSYRAGVVTGFVQEVDAEQGRVLVEYRGMQESLLSPWAYVAAPMSGQGRGALFMPEEGDEVLVCFSDGDFNHPFIVGFLWNGEQRSPETHAYNRVIVTPGGHQLRFEDKKNDRRVILSSDGGHSLTLEDKTAEKGVSLKSNGSREVRLEDHGTGKVVVTSGRHEIVMDDMPAGSKVTISAGKGAGVTITMNQTPQPSLSISVAGNTIDVGASGLSISAPAGVSVTTGGTASITCSSASITAGSLSVAAGISTFAGTVVCSSLVAGSVASPLYSPGIGNFI